MLRLNTVTSKHIGDYSGYMTPADYAELHSLARALAGKRVIHINATPRGGGVAEMLHSLVPLEQSLGIDSMWYSLEADLRFFAITKKLHNALQGNPHRLTFEEKKYYLQFNRRLAYIISALHPDLVVIHDPQPLAHIQYLKSAPTMLRIHIDLTRPQQDALEFITTALRRYDSTIFTAAEYIPSGIDLDRVVVSAPAIDPLSMKNISLTSVMCQNILRSLSLDTSGDLVVQVGRFDPWKNPLGALEAFQLVKRQHPRAKLVLAGIMEAEDDPEAMVMVQQVKTRARSIPDVTILSEVSQLAGVPVDLAINALQRSATVILHNSLREGFGLAVTEAMWKGKAVVGGSALGIALQIRDGWNGYIVHSNEQAADRLLTLLKHKDISAGIGERAHHDVQEKFLLTRLLLDELRVRVRIGAYVNH